jgi:hypothetical protein
LNKLKLEINKHKFIHIIKMKCEAVVEILQDDKIRNHLNPHARQDYEPPASHQQQQHLSQPRHSQHNQQQRQHHQNAHYYQSSSGGHHNNNNDYDDEPQIEDEDELLEMMAMQEECRMEMMKFYIQSQNPSLFEEIYHDVSYPEAMKKKEELAASSLAAASAASAATATATSTSSSSSHESNEKPPVTTTNHEQLVESVSALQLNESKAQQQIVDGSDSSSLEKIKEQVIDNLNTNSDEYKPQ